MTNKKSGIMPIVSRGTFNLLKKVFIRTVKGSSAEVPLKKGCSEKKAKKGNVMNNAQIRIRNILLLINFPRSTTNKPIKTGKNTRPSFFNNIDVLKRTNPRTPNKIELFCVKKK